MEKEKIKSGNIIDWSVLGRIMQFVKPYQGRFYVVVFLTVFLGFLTPVRAKLIQFTLDEHVAFGQYWSMVNVIIILLVLLVVQSVAQYAHTYISGRIGRVVIREIRIKL